MSAERRRQGEPQNRYLRRLTAATSVATSSMSRRAPSSNTIEEARGYERDRRSPSPGAVGIQRSRIELRRPLGSVETEELRRTLSMEITPWDIAVRCRISKIEADRDTQRRPTRDQSETSAEPDGTVRSKRMLQLRRSRPGPPGG